ncbi:tyrosine phosphatase [Colletotrichum plurivorum]|uniref:Tyrosine phosphatase n=1 Tax=Colletotrichum plurivorum TaxID=2175906 RepID=A0A8H6JS26_9PEZI|nr:tyrosine phosphatase [Colletotrichum plurivorum]
MASNSDISPSQLLELAETDVCSALPQAVVTSIIAQPPFLIVPGTFNVRDVGLVPGSPLRAGYIFRSGSLEGLRHEGFAQLTEKLGIKRVFDLRTGHEREKHPEPNFPGAEFTWVPNSYINAVDMADFVGNGGADGYCKMYMDMIEVYAPTIRAVLEHVRDRPREPFLFHCALGRDRTGIVAGLLESIAGANDETVLLDYLLTRIGSEPVRERLLERAIRDNGCPEGLDDPAFNNLCSLRAITWKLFVEKIEHKYGGFRGYVIDVLGFSELELEQIIGNLRG